MRTLLVASATLLLATTASADFWGCDNKEPRNASVAAAGVTRVVVVGRAGTLRVSGGAANEIRATGTACSSDEDLVKDIKLVATRRGTEVRVEAIIPEPSISWGTKITALDFEVSVPGNVAVDVTDSSGELTIENVGPLSVDDGSGELTIRGVHGDLSVKDGSGEMEIADVAGNVRVEDGSGAIDIKRVGGDVHIVDDGSGEIDIEQVKRNVIVDDDGSGALSVEDVGGDFTVAHKSSGHISSDRVTGRVSIPRRR